jgi:hypothetical protein
MAPRAPFYPSIAFVSNLVLHNLRHFIVLQHLAFHEIPDPLRIKVMIQPMRFPTAMSNMMWALDRNDS